MSFYPNCCSESESWLFCINTCCICANCVISEVVKCPGCVPVIPEIQMECETFGVGFAATAKTKTLRSAYKAVCLSSRLAAVSPEHPHVLSGLL